MFELSPAKKLLILLSTVSTAFAIVLSGVILLSNQFAPTEANAAVIGPISPDGTVGAAPADGTSAARPVIAAAAVSPAAPTAAGPVQAKFDNEIRPLLAKYCFDCHGDGTDKGDLTLDGFKTILSVQKERNTWQKVADNLHTKAMPPPKKKTQPTEAERKQIIAWVNEAFAWYDPAAPSDPGRVTIRRLNRNEYNNTIRDLLGVTGFKPAAEFPADDTGYGFDNIADVLTMSPLLAEKYLSAAEQVVDKALSSPVIVPPSIVRRQAEDLSSEASSGQVTTGPRGSLVLMSEGEAAYPWVFPATGTYEIRLRVGAQQAGDEPARFEVRLDNQTLQSGEIKGKGRRPRTQEIVKRLEVQAGTRRVAVAFLNDFYNESLPERERDRNLLVFSVEVAGPYDVKPPEPTASFKQVFFTKPGPGVSDEQAAAKIIERFATRAFRRPADKKEVEGLVALFKEARADGESFEGAIKVAATAVLVSPSFLFRIEQERSSDPNQPYAIDNYELASRLSYFLWSSMPDDALLAKAGTGELGKPEGLRAEVRRMLADPKAEAIVTFFAGQWLELRNLERATIDRKLFPAFDENLRADMRREAELFFQTIIKEDRSVLELLDADYTFVNERLAKHYGMSGVSGNDFRKVSLAGTRRGGVLTMAGVLTVTAMPTRTSPVKRGKFVLEQILGTPPPPAPPDVTALSDKPQDVLTGSLRQRLEQHRADLVCASCHTRMDPIGFAMENFDAIGRWRDKDGGFTIDASGTLPEGQSFNGPDELRKVLAARKGDFVRCLTEKMMTYALGRGVELHDKRTVNEITASVEKNGHKFTSLVDAIVSSDAFLKRRAKRGDE